MTVGSDGNPTSSVYLYEPFGHASPSITFATVSSLDSSTNEYMGRTANPTRKVEGAFTVAIIQMGARVYLPSLGRFLQVDTVDAFYFPRCARYNNHMIKAVIFDMDGVLADTVTIGRNARQKVLDEHYGIDLNKVPDPQGQDHRAASMKTLLASIEAHTGTRIDHDEFHDLEHGNMENDLRRLLKVDPALIRFLDELEQHGIVCAVVTTSQRSGADLKLELLGIRQYFSIVVTGNEIEHHKPHPEGYLHALEKLGLSAADCIIFEDSLTGVQAGLAAGCRVINLTQYNPPQEVIPGVLATISQWRDMTYSKLLSLEKRGKKR